MPYESAAIFGVFLASIGYILVLAVAVLYHIEWLVDEIDTIDLQFAAGCLIASYLCFLAVYSIAVYVISTIRYQGAQKKLKWYGKELDDLQNMYEEQEKSGKKSGRRRKEKLKEFSGSCSGIVLPIVKFLLALAVFRGINSNLGYLKMLNSMYVVLILSLICAILPLNGMVFLAMLVIIGHCFALHMVIAGLALCRRMRRHSF